MRKLWIAALLVLTAPACTFLLTSARADQNPVPTNVGLYNFSTFTVGVATAIKILPRNAARAGLIIQNQGGVSVVIKPGSLPTNSTDGIVLVAGAIIQLNPPPVDALYGQSASSTAKIVMIENIK